MNHTVKNILKRARKIRAGRNVHPDASLTVLVLVERASLGLPNTLRDFPQKEKEELNLTLHLMERAALSLDRIRSMTILAVVDHLRGPIESEPVRMSIQNATATARIILDLSHSDLVY